MAARQEFFTADRQRMASIRETLIAAADVGRMYR
jgi:hypothetical protein